MSAKKIVDHNITDDSLPEESSIFVQLGWVPKDRKKEITLGSDDIPKLESDANGKKDFLVNLNINEPD